MAITPVPKLEIDWNNDGDFRDTGETIDNGRIRGSLRWQYGRDKASQLEGRSIAGRLHAVLENTSGDYSSFNTSSAIAGLILPKRTVRLSFEGRAAQFTAANTEYLSAADSAGLSTGDIDFSITCWVRLDSIGADRTLMAKWQESGNNREFRLFYDHSSLRFRFEVSASGTSSVANVDADELGGVSINTWYFVACSHNATANTITIQVNDGTVDSVSHTGGLADKASTFTIGSEHGGANPHDGRIVAALYTKKVLSAAEKTFLYNDGSGRRYAFIGLTGDGSALKTSLQGWWDLNEASGTRADSENANTLTDNNTVTDAAGIANYPAWQGFLQRLVPHVIPGGGKVAVLEAIGPLGIVNQDDVSIAMQTAQRTDQLVDTILTDAGWPTAARTVSTGKTTVTRYTADRKKTLDALREIESAENGFIRETKDGRIAFEDRHFRLAGAQLTSQATFSDAGGAALGYSEIQQEDPLPFIFNQFEADITLYTVGSLATLWTHPETGSASPLIPVGESRTFTARFPNPQSSTNSWSVDAWTTPAATTDVTANSQSGGGGTNLTSSIGIAATKTGNSMAIVLTNNHATTAAYITLLKARGTPVTINDQTQISKTDATSQTAFGQRIWPSRPRYIPNSAEALDWASFNLSIYKDAIAAMTVSLWASRDQTHYNEFLEREVSDRVTVVATNNAGLGINREFFIEQLRHEIRQPGAPVRMTMLLSDAVQVSDWWVLGSAGLGGGTRLVY